MNMMRKLMMGAAPGERILVNTTTETINAPLNPPMKWEVGSSYSISWTGTIPSSDVFYLLEVTPENDNSLSCIAYGLYGGFCIYFWGTQLYGKRIYEVPKSIAIDVRFKIIAVSTSAPYYTADVELYINGTKEVSRTCDITTDSIDSFRYYRNAAGIFIIKKLS